MPAVCSNLAARRTEKTSETPGVVALLVVGRSMEVAIAAAQTVDGTATMEVSVGSLGSHPVRVGRIPISMRSINIVKTRQI